MVDDIHKLIGEVDFDPDAIATRYRQERDKRLRPDGAEQYIDVEEDFSEFTTDPWAGEGKARPPRSDFVQFTIIGAGFGGMMMGARLQEAGLGTPRLIDIAADFGGTWYWNRYPGSGCDIESYIYMPFLEETGYMPNSKYAPGSELFEHSRRIARHFDLYKDVLFQTRVTSVAWLEVQNCWQVITNRGDDFRTRYLFIANGSMDKPKLPGIPGIRSFKGHTFHTARWDYAYTRGDATGNLSGLADKRVAIVGTGCTAVQCIPALAASAKHLYVIQRTPSTVDARGDHPTDTEWFGALTPGWQRERMKNFDTILDSGELENDLVSDGWTEMFRTLTRTATKRAEATLGRKLTKEERVDLLVLSDHKRMNEIRQRIETLVSDPKTAEALKPWYRMFCKRPTFNDGYLDVFNRDNVDLIDTDGRGLDRITETGFVVSGHEYPVDLIVFASGFEVNTSYTHRAGYDVAGVGGKRLSEYWANGLRTLHGMTADGFPNLFFIGRTQTATPLNYTYAIDNQTRHIQYILQEMTRRGADYVEPTTEAVDDYIADVKSMSRYSQKYQEDCTPSYYNNEGKVGRNIHSDTYGGGSVKFFSMIDAWRAAGDLKGLVLRKVQE